ncbi:hypothetical protein M0R45_034048 [Rubus argutus]|uniref:Fe2OG dioxygenase domain-containing protein n=1 Tax=Rubus argutus TaxID=59490 RepID=A0AAW1VT62_RUBAR
MAALKSSLTADLVSGATHVPSQFIRPEHDRPNFDQVIQSSDHSIPLIDLHGFDGSRRTEIIKQIGLACQDYGFFQVKNHGVKEAVIDNVMAVAKEFFHLPASERMKVYSEDPYKTVRLSTSFNVKAEDVPSWRDYLRLHCHPLEDYIHEWPSNPPSFREDVAEYCKKVRGLAVRLLEGVSESLGLDRDYISKALGKHGQHMAMNYYPPCPEPELTYGLPGHADPNVVTLLLQDDVGGLQVLKDGKWLAVKPIPHTFIVNLGDQMQALSNDRYKSILHRAVVNSDKERISIPTFYCPSYDAVIEPAPKLVDDDHPAQYRSFSYGEFYGNFWDKGLKNETCLGMFKTN